MKQRSATALPQERARIQGRPRVKRAKRDTDLSILKGRSAEALLSNLPGFLMTRNNVDPSQKACTCPYLAWSHAFARFPSCSLSPSLPGLQIWLYVQRWLLFGRQECCSNHISPGTKEINGSERESRACCWALNRK